MEKYTLEEVLWAIRESRGIMKVIAERLGCDWRTARRYCNKWETTRVALASARNALLDRAEQNVFDAIEKGDVQESKWLLSRLGRDRGYGDRTEIVGDITYRVKAPPDKAFADDAQPEAPGDPTDADD